MEAPSLLYIQISQNKRAGIEQRGKQASRTTSAHRGCEKTSSSSLIQISQNNGAAWWNRVAHHIKRCAKLNRGPAGKNSLVEDLLANIHVEGKTFVINIKPKGFWGYMKELTINERIRDREVRLIGSDGTQYGVISINEARQIADEQGLDLCKVSPDGVTPATCKLMDYGKYRYEQQKKEKEAKKNQKVIEIKEIRLSATIDTGDTTRLAAQTAKFLAEGNKVKASIRLKGRQQAHPELAVDIINDYIALVGDCTVEKKPTQEGRNIFTILAPAKK